MFENLFTTSPLAWGGLIAGLIALPILIHLINMMRHRRVKWAAMEFLLKSYKKNRNWVWLKQLLLLLSRIAALLLALFMLAQIGCNNEAMSLLTGSKTTHHYVLIDDSFSMQDRVGESTVFERARSTLALIAARAKDRGQQRFTILRFSRATRGGIDPAKAEELGNTILDMNGAIVDSRFDESLENIRSKLTISELSVGPEKPLEFVDGLIQSRGNEDARVYVLSDFRATDWQQSSEVADKIKSISQLSNTKIELINCVEKERHNLAIVGLRAVGNVRAENTPLEMEVSVKNFGQTSIENIQVKCQSWVYPIVTSSDANAAELKPEVIELPTVFIEKIKPGETESRKFPLSFDGIGQHVITAQLEDKSVAADNRAFAVCQVYQNANVLIVDGHPDRLYSYILSTNLSPAGQRTGIRPDTRSKTFLRDATAEILAGYDVIMLAGVDRLDEPSLRNVEQFVSSGGGLAIFMGPNCDLKYYNDILYRNGEGPLPLPLERTMTIPEQTEDRVADIVPQNHPITSIWMDMENSPLEAVQIFQIARPPELYLPADDQRVEIAATIRGNQRWPLIATKTFGDGRVCIVTTSPGQPWNNWPNYAAFPVFPLQIENWLAAGKYAAPQYMVGGSMTFNRANDQYQGSIQWVSPGNEPGVRVVSDLDSRSLGDDSTWQLQLKNQVTDENIGINERIGIYEAWFKTTDGKFEVERMALNADPSDSDLTIVTNQQLAAELEEAKPSIMTWSEFNPEIGRNQTTTLSKILLIILIVILLGEQALAYLLSYHPKRTSRSAGVSTVSGYQN